MINITQWRVSVGLWACRQSSHSKETPNTEISSRIDGVTIIRKIKDLTFSLGVFLSLLLILLGDVELNPGPETGNLLKKQQNLMCISIHVYLSLIRSLIIFLQLNSLLLN